MLVRHESITELSLNTKMIQAIHIKNDIIL